MAGGYSSQPEGVDWIIERFTRIESMLATMSGANPAESTIITGPDGLTLIDPTSGRHLQLAKAFLRGWQEGDTFGSGRLTFVGGGIQVTADPRIVSAQVGETMIELLSRSDADPGYAGMRTSGNVQLISADIETGAKTGNALISAARVEIDGNALGLYSLPTTSAASNLHLGTVGGVWTVAYVTSSRRYKRDIRPTSVKPENVLAVDPVTFLEKTEVEAVGTDAPWRQGFIAEQVAEHTPQFVGLDDDGEPNSVDYDRFASVGHQVVLQAQQREIDDLKTKAVEKDEQIAALLDALAAQGARLEALEAT